MCDWKDWIVIDRGKKGKYIEDILQKTIRMEYVSQRAVKRMIKFLDRSPTENTIKEEMGESGEYVKVMMLTKLISALWWIVCKGNWICFSASCFTASSNRARLTGPHLNLPQRESRLSRQKRWSLSPYIHILCTCGNHPSSPVIWLCADIWKAVPAGNFRIRTESSSEFRIWKAGWTSEIVSSCQTLGPSSSCCPTQWFSASLEQHHYWFASYSFEKTLTLNVIRIQSSYSRTKRMYKISSINQQTRYASILLSLSLCTLYFVYCTTVHFVFCTLHFALIALLLHSVCTHFALTFTSLHLSLHYAHLLLFVMWCQFKLQMEVRATAEDAAKANPKTKVWIKEVGDDEKFNLYQQKLASLDGSVSYNHSYFSNCVCEKYKFLNWLLEQLWASSLRERLVEWNDRRFHAFVSIHVYPLFMLLSLVCHSCLSPTKREFDATQASQGYEVCQVRLWTNWSLQRSIHFISQISRQSDTERREVCECRIPTKTELSSVLQGTPHRSRFYQLFKNVVLYCVHSSSVKNNRRNFCHCVHRIKQLQRNRGFHQGVHQGQTESQMVHQRHR